MIIQLISDFAKPAKPKDRIGYRSYLDTKNGDVIIQTTDDPSGFMFGYSITGYSEVIVRGCKARFVFLGDDTISFRMSIRPVVDSLHINHKRNVVAFLRGYTQNEVQTLSEGNLDGILRDFANAGIREPDMEVCNANQTF